MDNMITLPYAYDADSADREILPFTSNAEFLEEKFREYILLVECSILRAKTKKIGSQPGNNGNGDIPKEQLLTDLMRKTKEYEGVRKKNGERLLVPGNCALPFVELTRNCRLDDTARRILWLLFFHAVAPDFDEISKSSTEMDDFIKNKNDLRMRNMVRLLAAGLLDEQMKIASYFGVESPLVKHHLVETYSNSARTFLDIAINIPMRVVKYIANDETEYDFKNAFIVEKPDVPLSFVILPEDQKKRIMMFIDNYERSLKKQVETGLNRVLTYGRSLTILLYGPPGTGKTLLAKAISSHTGRPLLSIRSSRFSSLFGRAFSDRYVDENDIEEIFREARMRNGIIFLDECEQFCSKDSDRLYTVLREIEHTDCIVIMTTNVPQELGEALDRRITLKVLFQVPEVSLRQRIWEKHLPEVVPLDPGVDLGALARKYQLTGGYIKNAVMSAINIAFSRNGGGAFMLTAEDLDEGAKLQEKHLGNLNTLIQHVQPDKDINGLMLPPETRHTVEGIINTAINYRVLTSRIRFISSSVNRGCKLLFFGPSFASAMDSVEAIACKLGTGICMVPFSKVFMFDGDEEKSYGDFVRSRALELSSMAHATGQVLLLVDREGNMGKFEGDNLNKASEFLSHFRGYDGTMFMVSAAKKPNDVLRELFHYSIFFDVMPPVERLQCWKRITEGVNLADDVDLHRIAEDFELGLEEIQNALYIACLISGSESAGGKIYSRMLEQGIINVLRRKTGVERLFGTDRDPY